jgi:general L-amino acid transport system permease protein
MQDSVAGNRLVAFFRDERVLRVLAQILAGLLLLGLFYFLGANMVSNLQRQGTRLSFRFFTQNSGFDIAESLIEYSRTSTYVRAFTVGFLNTVLVSSLGIVFSTILGVIVGVARISSNFLANRIARIYIEILRNIPLLVLLVFWYRAVFLKLPRVNNAIILPGPVYLTNRGLGVPWGIPTVTYDIFLIFLGAGLLAGILIAISAIRRGRQTGRMPIWLPWSLLAILLFGVVGWFVLPQPPLTLDSPFVGGLNMSGGKILSPEFMALLSGLVIYTSAFIAEVVRAGIQAISRGQVEAASALGFSPFQTLRLVIFPQALRVIIPPLTSQYLNLTKNSSLAVAIAYPDLFYVSSTIINQSGRAVEMISLVMLTYLITSLITALFMNWYNNRIRLVER